MKKLFCIFFCLITLTSCSTRHVYTEADRPHIYYYSEYDEPYSSNGAFAWNVFYSDLVVEGEILDEGTLIYLPMINVEEALRPYTVFQVKVKSVWFGEAEEKIIPVRMYGGIGEFTWKPEKGDEVVFLLQKKEDCCVPVGGYGVYRLTDDILQTLTLYEDCRDLDGEKKELLYILIGSAIADIANGSDMQKKNRFGGDLIEHYLNDYEPNSDVYVMASHSSLLFKGSFFISKQNREDICDVFELWEAEYWYYPNGTMHKYIASTPSYMTQTAVDDVEALIAKLMPTLNFSEYREVSSDQEKIVLERPFDDERTETLTIYLKEDGDTVREIISDRIFN